MEKKIADALRAEMPRILQWQFPVAVVEFRDGACETDAVPAAHLTDITWLDRGREYAVLVTLSEDEVHEALAEAEIAAGQLEVDQLVAYANGRDNDTTCVPCSLCGAPTEFRVGSTVADWYLCDDCAGTPEAEASGYAHV